MCQIVKEQLLIGPLLQCEWLKNQKKTDYRLVDWCQGAGNTRTKGPSLQEQMALCEEIIIKMEYCFVNLLPYQHMSEPYSLYLGQYFQAVLLCIEKSTDCQR